MKYLSLPKKNHIPIEDYRNEYRRLRSDDVPLIKAQKFKSAHTELRRLEKKRESLIEYFIDELNPISSSKANTSARSTGNLDLFNERVLYRKAISEKSGKEIVALVIKQRTEAAVEFQRSIEHSLDQLSTIASTIEQQQNKARRRIAP
ncbi:DUF4756 family protein [Salmonella enterica]|nr:DUF4756 family protein [Salmonella enterica]